VIGLPCRCEKSFLIEEALNRITESMLDEIVDFAWYRYLDLGEAIQILLRQGLSSQGDTETPHGDRRRSDREVVVDSRLE